MEKNSSSNIAHLEGIDLWYETFGNPKNTPILLIMGACCQGILWPIEFCTLLASHNFFVIRYDHRDMGRSTSFDFKTHPYTHQDLADDASKLISHLKLPKCHIVGLSMGGPVTELLSIAHKEQVASITLIATSPDFFPLQSILNNDELPSNSLSIPKKNYLKWLKRFVNEPPKTEEKQLEIRLEGWQILTGDKVPFNLKAQTKLHKEFLKRQNHPERLTNHILSNDLSIDLIREAPKKITHPTLIIHGSQDPIFPPDHAKSMHKQIKNSRLVFIEGLGHVLHEAFYDQIAQKLTSFIRSTHT